jgi:hypothetical protein
MRRWPRRRSVPGRDSQWAWWTLPSVDEELLLRLHDSGKALLVAEQNNGFLWQNLLKALSRKLKFDGDSAPRSLPKDAHRIAGINTLSAEGKPGFIHSGTYEELTEAFGLSSAQLAETVRNKVEELRRNWFAIKLAAIKLASVRLGCRWGSFLR